MADYTRKGTLSEKILEIPATSRTSLGVLFSADTTGFSHIAVQVTSAGSATIIYEGSEDETNWVTLAGIDATAIATTGLVTSTTNAGIRIFPKLARFFRARVSAYTFGTVTVLGSLLTGSFTPQFGLNGVGVGQSGTWNVGLFGNNSTGGSTRARIQSAASNNATVVKASAGSFYGGVVGNNGAAVAYLKLYEKATAPTVGTDTPIATILLPIGGVVNLSPVAPMAFATGLGYGIVTGAADNDNTSVAANQVVGFLAFA